MNIVALLVLGIIWAVSIYGFVKDDMGVGLFGRCSSALAHAAMSTLVCVGVGALCYATFLLLQEVL